MRRVRRTAVIDMGSNSFRLVVYGWEPGRYWQHVDEIREAVRVSAGMSASGAIRKSRVKRAVQTAVVFASFCEHSGIDEVIPVAEADAFAMARRAARVDGIFSGPSPGANLVAALAVARRLGPGHRVVTVQVDSGLKYLTGSLYAQP